MEIAWQIKRMKKKFRGGFQKQQDQLTNQLKPKRMSA